MELPENLNVANYFLYDRLSEGRGDRTALIVDCAGDCAGDGTARRFTYADMAARADRFARVFVELGIEPEQRVLIAARDGEDFVAAFFGALKIGAAVVMVNPDVSQREASYFCRYTRAKVVVACPEAATRFAGVDDAPLLRRVIAVGDTSEVAPDDGRLCRYADLAPEDVEAAGGQVEAFSTHKDDPAIWLFSGGTTGEPKAVVQTHGSFVNTTVLYGQNVLGMTDGDVTLSVPKLYFGYATGSNLLFPMSVGATSILFPERVTAERLFELIDRHRPTVLINVPTMVGKMLASDNAHDADLSSLRVATSAGEALPEALFRRFKDTWGVELLDGLGTAEMWHVFISNRPGDVRPGTLGKAVPGFDVRVCNDDGIPVADGETGWLWVRGKSRALGYFQQHDKSCHAFRGDWYISGDMVRRDAEGVFTYCGRGDDMLKVGGKWLAPKEVEGCLVRHPAVEECAVVGVTDAAGLVKPYAFVRSPEPVDSLGETLKTWVRDQLEPYKAPRVVVFLDQFPRTHLGKIDRGALRKDAAALGGSQ